MKRKIVSFLLAFILCFCTTTAVFAADDAYSIISPQTSDAGITYCDNLLISVKVAENTALRFTLYTYPNYTPTDSLTEVPAAVFTVRTQTELSDTYEPTNHISFYTKQVNDIKPGFYALKIDTLNDNGNAVASYNKYFIVQSSDSKIVKAIYESKPSGKVLFFQSVFKSLFGSTTVE